MSLSTLTRRLRAHDWTAAVIELLIVVAGILIALQVSNWNQARQDRARAATDYQRLHDSLAADQEMMDAVQAFWRQVFQYGVAAMANAETGARVGDSNWKTVLAWYQAGQLMPFEYDDTTFVEMRERGDLGLIADVGLRTRLADYYHLTATGTIRANILRHDPAYRQQIRSITPWAVQAYIWEHCFRQLGGIRQELIDCPAPVSEAEAGAILGTYHAADGLLPNLRYWMATLKVSEIVIGDARRTRESLTRDIDAARNR